MSKVPIGSATKMSKVPIGSATKMSKVPIGSATKMSQVAIGSSMSQVTTSGPSSQTTVFEPDARSLEPAYSDPELANISRPRRLTLTHEQLKEAMEVGSNVPQWRTLLNGIYKKERKSRSYRAIIGLSGSNVTTGSGGRGTSSHLNSEERSSGEVVKRSEEITSELDVSRRLDLDDENMEKWWVKQATASHRRIVLFLVMLFAFTTGHLFQGLIWMFSKEIYPNPYLCDSPSCTIVSRDMLTHLDESIDPCEDFNLFACGKEWKSSKLIFERRQERGRGDDDWRLVTDAIRYDFSRSRTIGNILREKDPLLLPFHQACMDIQLRNKEKMDPYFDLLELVKLNTDKCDGTAGCGLETSMVALFERQVLWKKPFVINFDFESNTFRVQSPRRSVVHSVLRYGYDAQMSVMTGGLSYLAELGGASPKYHMDWGDEHKIEAYAKLFLCTELNVFPYYENGESGPVVWARFDLEKKLEGECHFKSVSEVKKSSNPTYMWSEFLKDPQIYKLIAPNSEPAVVPFNFQLYVSLFTDFTPHPMTQEVGFDERIWDGIFSNYDLTVRYLHWRILREYAFTMDAKLDRIFWPVTRNELESNFITACLHTLFQLVRVTSSQLYMAQIPEGDIQGIKKLMDRVYPIIDEMTPRFTFPNFLPDVGSELKQNLSRRAFNSAEIIWPQKQSRVGNYTMDVATLLRYVNFHKDKSHFWNVVRFNYLLSTYQRGIQEKFYSPLNWDNIKWNLESNVHRPLKGKCDSKRSKTTIVMPLGSFEPPYFGTNFPALDLGGVGNYAIQKLVEFAVYEGMNGAIASEFGGELFTSVCQDALNAASPIEQVQNYHKNLDEDAAQGFARLSRLRDLWKLPARQEVYNELGEDVNNLYSEQLCEQLAMKLTYEVHEEMIRKNSTVGKLVLIGLEKYNARQMFFIQTASRKCEWYSENKFKHKWKFGPLPEAISVNLLAANSKEFAKVFHCKKGARMNPDDTKRYNYYQ